MTPVKTRLLCKSFILFVSSQKVFVGQFCYSETEIKALGVSLLSIVQHFSDSSYSEYRYCGAWG